MKVVINKCYGGFGLSNEAFNYMGLDPETTDVYEIPRNDSKLVEAVETLGEKANGPYAELKVVEIPDDVEYYIHNYDGMESIQETHRSWS